MKLIACLLLLSALPILPADFSVSVGFPSAPQTPGCTVRRTDNLTAACQAALNGTQGTSLISIYSPAPSTYTLLGTIHVTQPPGNTTTVTASLSATLTEFAGITGGGVKLHSKCTADDWDCEALDVTVDGVPAGTLLPGADMFLPYSEQQPLSSIQLSAREQSTDLPAEAHGDYVGLINLTASRY